MRHLPIPKAFVIGVLSLMQFAPQAFGAEYQWSVSVPAVISDETKDSPRAFLWIPPACEHVSAVVLGQHNMLEEPLFENATFRKTMAELNFAIVWITPPLGGAAKFETEEAAHFDTMFRALADASGYAEIATTPIVPVGHSAMAEFPYLFAAQLPQRTLAAISLKGSWPDLTRKEPQSWIEKFAASGVPLLFVSGEYEWADERADKALVFRREFPAAPFSMLADAGGGHFDHHESLARFLADYLRSATTHRLGDTLKPIDTATQGWLVDRWRIDKTPHAPSAPVDQYTGDKHETYWCFDEAQARATEQLQAIYRGKKAQLLGYRQNGEVVAQVNGTHQQVTLSWLPDPAGDGLTFKLQGAFLSAVSAGRPERWSGQKAGTAIPHAHSGPITISRISGPVEKLSDDTFALRFDRLGFDNPRRGAELWFQVEHPGDDTFKRAVQQAVLPFPLRNTEGQPQTITFAEIPDQQSTAASIPLQASSSAAGQVRFYVREGPAEIEGNTLHLTAIPPRAKFPIKVTVVAWQWGRSLEPKLQSAEPAVRSFQITR